MKTSPKYSSQRTCLCCWCSQRTTSSRSPTRPRRLFLLYFLSWELFGGEKLLRHSDQAPWSLLLSNDLDRKTLQLEGQHLHYTAKGMLAMSRRSKKHLQRWIRILKELLPRLCFKKEKEFVSFQYLYNMFSIFSPEIWDLFWLCIRFHGWVLSSKSRKALWAWRLGTAVIAKDATEVKRIMKAEKNSWTSLQISS